MNLEIDGKTALVLGASKGIGYGIAQSLVNEGVKVAVTSRTSEGANAAASSLGGTARGYICDTGTADDIDALHRAVVADLAPPAILILNGGGPPPGPAQGVASDQWRQSFEAMFVNLVRLADLCLPSMVEQGYGRIISIISSGVIEPIPNLAISNAIRPALVGWGKTLAAEVACHGVTVNAVAPGRIATDRLKQLDANNAKRRGLTIEEIQQASMARIPAGRYGKAEEFGDLVTYLASPRAAFITGSVLRVDGGQIVSSL